MAMRHSLPHYDTTTDSPTKAATTAAKTMTPSYYALRHSLPSERSVPMETLDDMRRHSAPAMGSPLWARAVVPETILATTDVSIAGVAQRSGHCVYLLEIESGAFGAHVLDRRYSEIRAFRAQLLAMASGACASSGRCGHGPCAQLARLAQLKFPRRRLQLSNEANFDVAQRREPQLERFLRTVLHAYRLASRRELRACKNARCGALDAIRQFFEVCEPVVSDQETDGVATYEYADAERSVDYKMPLGLAPVYGPRSYNARSLCGGARSARLYSIEEQPEALAAH